MTDGPRTRKPTGRVAWPVIQVDGEEKSGKSYALAALTGSPRVGRSFLLDLGDGTLDEYASLGDYDLIDTNGTFGDVLAQVELAAAVPSDPERPNVIGIDAGTLLWGILKAKAERRARGSKRAVAILRDDPDAEIDVSMTYWNEVKDDWARLLHVLKRFPGISVITAQGRYVSKVNEAGQPVPGQQEWSTDIEKTTHAWCTAMVRLTRDPRQARLVGVRSLHVAIPTGGLLLPADATLDHLVFDLLGAGGFGPDTSTVPVVGVPVAKAKGRLLDAVKRHADAGTTDDQAKAAAGQLWAAAGLGDVREVTEAQLAGVLAAAGDTPEPEPEPAAPPESATPAQEPPADADAPTDATAATEAYDAAVAAPLATCTRWAMCTQPAGHAGLCTDLDRNYEPTQVTAYVTGLGPADVVAKLSALTEGGTVPAKRQDRVAALIDWMVEHGAPTEGEPDAA